MRYNEPLNLKLYKYENSQFVLQAIIDDYSEISFCHSLYEAGDFTITINYNIPNALKFERGLWVQFGNDSYMFGEISNITDSIGEDGKGSQIRIIIGHDARYIFKRRIIKNLNNAENWSMTAKGELCLRNLIKDQCGSGAEEKRQLPVTNTIPSSSNALGKEFSVSESFTNLYDVCVTIATQSEIGWRIKFDGSLTLEFYSGEDRHKTVRFDTDYESLANGEFIDSTESFANAIFVGGKGTGTERDIYEGETAIEGSSPAGFDRFEAWDNQSGMTTESEYEAEALSMLSQYSQTLRVEGKGFAKCPYEYGKEYNVGDIITIAFSGKSAIVQILSVTEHWIWGNYGLEFSFGKPQPDLNKQLQLILKQIQKASNKTNTTESVKWYNVATESSMPASDVIYNTIGFTGNLGTGKTFTLYLDDEKTGAKNYTIYGKNITGTGELVLTTGKADASNIALPTGTFIVKLNVDEDGNINGARAEEATHAISADSATNASHSTTADSATTAESTTTSDCTQALTKAVICTTEGNQSAKTVSLSGFTLVKGAKLIVDLQNVNTAASALTLNVNNTGAKTIRWNGTITSSSAYAMNATQYNCYYDGTYWNMDSVYEAKNARETNYANISGYSRVRQTSTCSTGASTVAKTVSLSSYTLGLRNEILIYFSNTNTASNPTLNVNSTGAKPIKVFGVSPNSTNGLLKAGTYHCQYDGTNWNCYPYGVTNEIAANNMQAVTSDAVYKYAKRDLYVECAFNGTNITVTNNLGRSDLKIECIGQKDGEPFSYVVQTTLSSTNTPQTISSYSGRQLNQYDMCIVNIINSNNYVIGSGIIANINSNQMGLDIVI